MKPYFRNKIKTTHSLDASHVVVNKNGKQHSYKKIGVELFISPSEFSKIHTNFWDNFYSKHEQVFIAVSYDFAKSLLLNLSSNEKGFLITGVEKTNKSKYILLPSLLAQQKTESYNRYSKNIHIAQECMKQGDFYLINYCFNQHHVFEKFKEHRKLPSDFGCYFMADNKLIASFSPENFIEINKHNITTYPIKGTIASSLAKSILRNDKKEKAELTMVTDLMRNDLGKLCKAGSVKVKKFAQIKRHHQLYQMFSTIEGKLARPFSPVIDLIKLLPAGSISGTPKHQVVSFLNNIETKQRSFYTGVAGIYNNVEQRGWFNIIIRGLECQDNIATLGLGSGITIDSIAEKEYQECLMKQQSILNQLK